MHLILLRHGIAIDRDHPDCPSEAERFLTEIGRAKTTAAARGMAALQIAPEAVISSPMVRAVQTAEIALAELHVDVELEIDDALVWSRPPGQILKRLRRRRESPIMLVGHAPHLDEVADFLLACEGATLMKKASVLEIDGSLVRGGGTLRAYYPPRALRTLAGSS